VPPPYVRHVFVCLNERSAEDPRGCCLARGGAAVRDAFKSQLHARNLARTIRTNTAGCLDACAHGVAVVVYPDAIWYGGVGVEDVPEIIEEHLIGGRPVERLVFARGSDAGRLGAKPGTPPPPSTCA
jgi:(2Fe-2S) ferredoxin